MGRVLVGLLGLVRLRLLSLGAGTQWVLGDFDVSVSSSCSVGCSFFYCSGNFENVANAWVIVANLILEICSENFVDTEGVWAIVANLILVLWNLILVLWNFFV